MSLVTCPPGLWVDQARSDREAARILATGNQPHLYCHSVAKSQQSVEKSVKAIAIAMQQKALISLHVNDYYRHDVSVKFIQSLGFAPSSTQQHTVLNLLKATFDGRRTGDVRWLCGLAPRKPKGTAPHPRNTEYPYEDTTGTAWLAPAGPSQFSAADVQRADAIAATVFRNAPKIMNALDRIP